MSNASRIVLKLGGSAITKKYLNSFPLDIDEIKSRADEYIRVDVVKRQGREIYDAMGISKFKLILVNGVGPFGHYLVEKRQPLATVHESVAYLNKKFIEYLGKGLKLESIAPNETCLWDGERFAIDNLWNRAQSILNAGGIPSTYGDILKGYKVISGDDLAVMLAKLWHADKIICAANVDGVFTKNPGLYKDAKLIKVISERKEIAFEKTTADVTGGLESKVEKLLSSGIKSQIVNGLVKGNVKAALTGDESLGTLLYSRGR